MAEVIGSLPSLLETWVEFLVPSFGLAQPSLLWALGKYTPSPPLLSLCLSNKTKEQKAQSSMFCLTQWLQFCGISPRDRKKAKSLKTLPTFTKQVQGCMSTEE